MFNNNKIKVNPVFKDNNIIKITLTIKINGSILKVVLLDSYLIFNKSLSDLTEQKTKFPYDFININTLDYNGIIPNINYFNNMDIKDYANNYNNKLFNTKLELLKYLENDLFILYNFIYKNNKSIYNLTNIDPSTITTISALSINVFNKIYPNNISIIPHIDNINIYNYLKEALYGGINEVYKPKGKKLYGYDVNSLYPAIAVNNPIPGLEVTFIKSYDKPLKLFIWCI